MNFYRSFFEISCGPQLENTFEARLLCLKDFSKKVLCLPFALLYKAYKTLVRGFGVCLGVALLLLTLGNSASGREFFASRITSLADDLAEWILFPVTLCGSLLRLLLAFLIHPNFYFNSLY